MHVETRFESYTLPAHWACHFINGDDTGYTDEELQEITAWYADNEPGWCVDVADDAEFTWKGDDGNLGADRATFTFQQEI